MAVLLPPGTPRGAGGDAAAGTPRCSKRLTCGNDQRAIQFGLHSWVRSAGCRQPPLHHKPYGSHPYITCHAHTQTDLQPLQRISLTASPVAPDELPSAPHQAHRLPVAPAAGWPAAGTWVGCGTLPTGCCAPARDCAAACCWCRRWPLRCCWCGGAAAAGCAAPLRSLCCCLSRRAATNSGSNVASRPTRGPSTLCTCWLCGLQDQRRCGCGMQPYADADADAAGARQCGSLQLAGALVA